jgi:3-phenylpropionate/trans-cinnamate dioxygenase ferredoxin reductase subunit
VQVDERGRTSLADVFAVGDCALHVNPYARGIPGARVRLESVQAATDQASIVARAILGLPESEPPVPWFWSNQYDLRLQTVGLSTGHDRIILRGSPADRQFTLVYLAGGRIIALDCINSPKEFIQGRMLVREGVAPPLDRVANVHLALKELIGTTRG